MTYLGYSIAKTTNGYSAEFRGLVSPTFPTIGSLKAFLRKRNAQPLEDRAAFKSNADTRFLQGTGRT